MEKATFAAGCFWGVQALFDKVKGVTKTTVGYSGGNKINPTYKQVSTGTTGHAESIEIEYDPMVVSYRVLLNKFWEMHDPTTKNRQGPDIGTQYRSVIFYHTDRQKELAEKSMELERRKHRNSIVTEILPAKDFYPAEEYHQKYAAKNGKAVC
jgi:peptide-methionine (S)-S-oxide reductase